MGNQPGREGDKTSSKAKSGKKKVGKKLSNTSNDVQNLCDVNSTLTNYESISENENIFIALYDFKSGGSNQHDLTKGEILTVPEYNSETEWVKVKKFNCNSCDGWVPTKYIASVTSFFKFPWFHGPMSRNGAEYLLSSGINGSFLVRDSESCPGQLTISLRFEEIYYHYKIHLEAEQVFVTPENRFTSLDELVKWYSVEPGLMTCLQYAVLRVNKPTIFELSPDMEKWEISRNEIEMKQLLGSGQYGDVYQGMWISHNIPVAVKTLREDTTDLTEFLKEVTIMKEMKHPNLVQLLGICTTEPPFYIITEFLKEGNLLLYIHNNSDELEPIILFYMATQVASAMVYLEQKNFIHRDLAARNCLVGDHHLVKVADFGLARLMQDEVYTAQTGCKFPIKWTAPEGLAYGTFSTKSDVWAFGVLLWELATYGQAPFSKLELSDVYNFLEKGNRLSCPNGCPHKVYDLMMMCWKWEPTDRPTFREIHNILDNIYQNSDNSNNNSESTSSQLPLVPVQRQEISISKKAISETQSISQNTSKISERTDYENQPNIKQEAAKQAKNPKTAKDNAPEKMSPWNSSSADAEKSNTGACSMKLLPPKPNLDSSRSATSAAAHSTQSRNPSSIISPNTSQHDKLKKSVTLQEPSSPTKIETESENNKLNSHDDRQDASSSDNSSRESPKQKVSTSEVLSRSLSVNKVVHAKVMQSTSLPNKNIIISRRESEDRLLLHSSTKDSNAKPPILKPKPLSLGLNSMNSKNPQNL